MIRSLVKPLVRPMCRPLTGYAGVRNILAPVIAAADTLPGTELSVSDGGWLGEPTAFTYQWTRAGVDIAGATANTYTLTAADMGRPIACKVTALPSGSVALAAAVTGGSEFQYIFLPALDGSMTPRVGTAPTHSRASGGMYHDATGKLRWAEENLLLRSEEFDNALWVKGGLQAFGGGSYANAILAPDGSDTTGDLLIENSSNSLHRIYQTITTGFEKFTFSVYVRAAGRTEIVLGMSDSATGAAERRFDLSAGTHHAFVSGAGSWSEVGGSIEDAGNGWYRCSVTGRRGGGTNVIGIVNLYNGATTYLGDGASGVYLWGAKLCRAEAPGAYVKTTAASYYAPRLDHRYVGGQWVSQGYVAEGARTNLLQYSRSLTNAWWSFSSVTSAVSDQLSPEGALNAFRVTETAASAAHYFRGADISYTSGNYYSFSSYAKQGTVRYVQISLQSVAFSGNRYANFDLQTGTVTQMAAGVTAYAEPVGDGWYRLVVTAAASSTTTGGSFYLAALNSGTAAYVPGYAGNTGNYFHCYLPQMEVISPSGGGASSPIPTYGGTATRSADICTLSDITSLAISDSMTLVAAATSFSTTNVRLPILIGNAGTTNYSHINLVGAAQTFEASAVQASLTLSVPPLGAEMRAASRVATDSFIVYSNGVGSSADNSGVFPTGLTTLRVGSSGAGGQVEGPIRALLVSNLALTNAQLSQISTSL